MLTYKVTAKGVLDKSGKDLPIGATVKFPKEPAKEWLKRLELVDGKAAEAELHTTQEPEQKSEPELDSAQDDDDLTGEEQEEIDLDTISDDDLRELAKEYGIKSWHNKKRETLIDELTSE